MLGGMVQMASPSCNRRIRIRDAAEQGPTFWEVLGAEFVETMVLARLDACSLARLSACCKAFRSFGPAGNHLRLVERVAQRSVLEANRGSLEEACRWRMGWLERLYVEDSFVGFDRLWEIKKPDGHGFKFFPDPTTGVPQILLMGMGPKLLLSDVSTAQQPLLRWRLVVRGNTAVEFGVVPAGMQYEAGEEQSKVHKALHKCKHPDGTEFRENIGFSSAITVGSMLPFKVPLMKGSVVEVLASRGRFQYLVVNPPDAQELFWQGAGHAARTVPKPYKGPQRFAMEQYFDPAQEVRLALTCWAQGVFDVAPPEPGLFGPRTCGVETNSQERGMPVPAEPSGSMVSDAGPSGSGSSSAATAGHMNAATALHGFSLVDANCAQPHIYMKAAPPPPPQQQQQQPASQQQHQQYHPQPQQQQQQQAAAGPTMVDLMAAPESPPSDHSVHMLEY